MSRRMIKYTLLAIILLMQVTLIYAGDAGRESQFSLGSGVRALGMGGGFVGVADDASAVYWNQAGLARLEYQQVDLMHVTLNEGTIYDVASYVYPHHRLGGFGISFMRLGTGDIIRRDNWMAGESFSYSIMQMIFGYGRGLGGDFSVGTALKIVNQSMDDNSAYGFGMDLSLLKPVSDNISAGLIFQDIIQPRLRLGSVSEMTPYNIIAGLGFRDLFATGSMRYIFNTALEIPEDRDVRIHLGGEVILNRLNFRAGYDRDNLAFGFGIGLERFRFDYAYRLMDGLTDSHRFGLSFNIGASVSERIQLNNEAQTAMSKSLIKGDRTKQSNYYRDLGDKYFNQSQMDSALIYYQRALAYDPENGEVLSAIEEINRSGPVTMPDGKVMMSNEVLQKTLMDGFYAQASEFYSERKYIPSLSLVERALRIEPDEPRFTGLKENINASITTEITRLVDLARKAENEGRLSEAIKYYNQILDLSPGDIRADKNLSRTAETVELARMISLGAEQFYNNQFPQAKKSFENVLRIDPENGLALEYIERIDELTRKPGTLEDIREDEETWNIYLNAMQLYQEGKYGQAIELWQKVLDKYPGNDETLENIRQANLRLRAD